jgi:hypothetical protein
LLTNQPLPERLNTYLFLSSAPENGVCNTAPFHTEAGFISASAPASRHRQGQSPSGAVQP